MPWVVGVLCALLPLASHALGLGKLKVHSALNQPLNAEIEFTSLSDAETKGLNIGLASRADFTAAGVDRAAFLSQIKFTIVRRADGRRVLQLTTHEPIQEPFLHMLLQLDWTGGRLVREYTALIDPPYQISAKAPTVEPPRATAPAVRPEPALAPVPEPVTPPAAPVEAARVAPIPAPVAPAEDQSYGPSGVPTTALSADGWPSEEGEAPAAIPEAPKTAAKGRIGPAPSWANTASYTVSRGDTLWSIAKKVRSDSQVSVEQAALAIYNHNRDAFYGNNLNNIRAGKILGIPERDIVEAMSKKQAHVAFQGQFDAWQEYKRKLASAKRTVAVDAAETTEEKPASDKKPAAEAATTKKEATVAAKGQRQDELLKIVRANLEGEKGADARKTTEPSKAGEREQSVLADRAATLEESLVSKQIEQKELGEKINQVRAQLKREARLIELESKALAPAPDKAAKPAETPKAEAPKAEPAKPEAPKVEAPSAVAPKPLEAPKTEAPAPKPAPKKLPPPPPPVPEKGLLDTLLGSLGDLLLPAILAIAVLASAVIGLVYMRRRRKATAEFEESILASQAMTTENAQTRDATGEAGASAAESSILSDISQGNLTNVRTDEVDPIAEAEVYLAYGRDETAEEILKDAVVKHPQRHELKLKLLEIYAARKDVKAFETLAEELYAAVGGQGGKLWEKVEEMGGKISPNNPMFRGASAKTAASSPAPTVAVAPTEVAAPPTAAIAPETALDFDLGTPAVTTSATKESSFNLDFDMGEVKPVASKPAAAPAAPTAAPKAEAGGGAGLNIEPLDLGAPAASVPAKEAVFDLDFDLGAPVPSAAGEAKPVPPTGEDIKLDLGDSMTSESVEAALDVAATPPASGAQQQWDEAATKLDLARAYIDMGDAEGARSILGEVIAEGSAEQKKQAQDLIAQIH